MKKRAKRWVGALALAAGAVGTTLLLRRRRSVQEKKTSLDHYTRATPDRWARPGMGVTFRAELMPGRSRAERTYRVVAVLPSGRVTVEGFAGEHTESEFEPLRPGPVSPKPEIEK
jgi:hypothetical protein